MSWSEALLSGAMWVAIIIGGASFAFPNPALADTPQQIADLSRSGAVQFQCGDLAQFAGEPSEVGKHYLAGLGDFRKFLTEAPTADPKELQAAINKTTPLGVIFDLHGPTDDFIIGRIFQTIIESVDDELRGRNGLTHQKKDPSADEVPADVVRMSAARRYREENCALLK